MGENATRETTNADIGALGSEFEPPLLLMAMPQVLDPFFHQSVVLLVHHQPEGSLGFIVNRPTHTTVHDVLEGLDLVWHGDRELPAYFGGPVEPQLGTVIFAAGDGGLPADDAPSEPTASEVAPGIAMSQHIRDLAALAKAPPAALRLLLGYAGWGDGQLEHEILRNDWMVAPVSGELLFGLDPRETWARAFTSIGVDPETLPTWTPNDDRQGEAN